MVQQRMKPLGCRAFPGFKWTSLKIRSSDVHWKGDEIGNTGFRLGDVLQTLKIPALLFVVVGFAILPCLGDCARYADRFTKEG